MRCGPSPQNVFSAGNVVRESTGHYEEINELNIKTELPVRNPVQSAGYSRPIHNENIVQQAYDSLSSQEFPDRSIEQLQPSFTVVETRATDGSEEIGTQSSNCDTCHTGLLSDRKEPYCETEIPSDYLTIT